MKQDREKAFGHHIADCLVGITRNEPFPESRHTLSERGILIRPLTDACQSASEQDQRIVERVFAGNRQFLAVRQPALNL
jgi:hypothetical protein